MLRTLTPAPLPSDGRGGELLWGRNPGRRSFLACPGLVCVTLSGFLGRERWRRFGVNGRESRGKKVSVSILWLGLGRHASPPGCAGTTPVDRGITKRRCGVRAGSRCASTPGYLLSSLRDALPGPAVCFAAFSAIVTVLRGADRLAISEFEMVRTELDADAALSVR